MKWMVLVTVVALSVVGPAIAESYRRVCYFTNWSQYRSGNYQFKVANITDVTLCTHYIFAFSKVLPENDTLGTIELNDDGPTGSYKQLTDLKKTNPDVKVLLAVGGWSEGSMPFVKVVSSDARVSRFCDNVVKYLRDRNFDGVDLDWEYPAHRGSNDTDRERFTFLMQTLRKKFEEEADVSGKSRLLLTSAVPAQKVIVEKGYEVEKLGRAMDFINLMAYDMDVFRGGLYYNGALYARADDKPPNDTLNVDASVDYWASRGMPREKIVVGIPIYARQYEVRDGSNFMYGEPFKVNITAKALKQPEICETLRQDWTTIRDNEAKTAVMHNDQYWVNYEDEWTLDMKSNYIKDRKLGGFMIWELSLDDFGGVGCGRGRYPTLSRLKHNMLRSKAISPVGGSLGFLALLAGVVGFLWC